MHTAGYRRQGGANGGGVASDNPNTTRRHKVERARSSRCAGASSSCVRERRRWGGALQSGECGGWDFHVRRTKVQNSAWCAEGVWRGCGHGGAHPPHDQQEHLLMCEILHLTLPTLLQRTPPPTVVGWVNSGHENQRLSFMCLGAKGPASRKGSTCKACQGGAAPLSTRREEALARTINAVGWRGTARRWWAGEGRRGLLTMMKRWWSCGCGQHPEEIQFHAFRL